MKAKLEASGVQFNEVWNSGACHGPVPRPDGYAILLPHDRAVRAALTRFRAALESAEQMP